MNFSKHTAYVLAAVAFAACAEPEREAAPVPASGMTRVTLRSDGSQAVSVHAFRRQGDLFLYDTTYREGWTPEGRLAVRMPNGQYKFLFAAGGGANLALEPAPAAGTTAWDEARFTLKEDPQSPGSCLPADELFLQYPAAKGDSVYAKADSIYTAGGEDLTVSARLTRAVCRIGISLNRGYLDGAEYIRVPYTQPRTILDEIERIELTAGGTALYAHPDGNGGTAVMKATLAAADYTRLTDEGFVELDGPFVIPPAGGSEIELELTVVPAAGSALRPNPLKFTGKAERNKRLDITLWITSDYPAVGVEIRTEPIGEGHAGDSGIWE